MIDIDSGYYFGMGVFETIAIEKGKPLFLEWHLERMVQGLSILNIHNDKFEEEVNVLKIEKYLMDNPMQHGVLKIMVSEKNITFTKRDNNYTKEDYEKGFRLGITDVYRNETSKLTYIKSFHYGDNLMEKSKIKKQGYDEVLFFNSRGEVVETSASSIFFIKGKEIYTPKLECGLLNGIVRRYIIENYKVNEVVINKENMCEFDEAFLTNSLMGIMPVYSINYNNIKFKNRNITLKIMNKYKTELINI